MGFPSHSASAAAAPRDRLVGILGTHLLAVLENCPRRAVRPGQQISRSDFDRIANGTPKRQGRANRRSI